MDCKDLTVIFHSVFGGYLFCGKGKTLPLRNVWNSGCAGRVQSVKLIENWLWLLLGRWRERSAACRVVGLIPHLLLTAIEVSLPLKAQIASDSSLCACCLPGCVREKAAKTSQWASGKNHVWNLFSRQVIMFNSWSKSCSFLVIFFHFYVSH